MRFTDPSGVLADWQAIEISMTDETGQSPSASPVLFLKVKNPSLKQK